MLVIYLCYIKLVFVDSTIVDFALRIKQNKNFKIINLKSDLFNVQSGVP